MKKLIGQSLTSLGIILVLLVIAVIVINSYLKHKADSDFPLANKKTNSLILKADTEKDGAIIPESSYIFPKNFMWGVATSAFQNEGGDGKTDWDNWPAYKNSSANYPSFAEKDIHLVRKLGIKYFRFSIEWAKVEPKEGKWDKKALAHYIAFARAMQRNGIEPMVNLNHFTLPQWMAERGGWENDSSVIWFGRYAKKIAEAFKTSKIKWWMTFNEPTVLIDAGYLRGVWPPGKKESDTSESAMRALRNLKRAHRTAYKSIHSTLDKNGWKPMVGIAHFSRLFVPYDAESEKDREATKWLNFATNHDFIEAIEDHLDYLGLNYYSRTFIKFSAWGLFFGQPVEFVNKNDGRADNGAEIYPAGIYELVREFRKYKLPIIITENGIDDEKDIHRKEFIIEHLRWVHKAVAEPENKETPVIGYFYWTLIDNAEWLSNKPAHFGLIAMDSSRQRVPRSSAYLLRDIAKTNGLTREILEKHKIYEKNQPR